MESVFKTREIGTSHGRTANKRSNQKAEIEICAAAGIGHFVLSEPVQTKCAAEVLAPELVEAMQHSFFNSHENLCQLYQIPLEIDNAPFPQNILTTLSFAKSDLKKVAPQLEIVIVTGEDHLATVTTVETYEMGHHLYYIPVKGLFNLLQEKSQEKTAKLTTSILAYLLQVAGVPFYTDYGSYLSGEFESTKDMYADDDEQEDNEYRDQMFDEFDEMMEKGAIVRAAIADSDALLAWGERITNFEPANSIERELHSIAKKFYELYQQYPNHKAGTNIHEWLYEIEDHDRISLKEVLSFYWECEGELTDNCLRYISENLNERGHHDMPTSLQFFDTLQAASTHDLQFEEVFYELINDISKFLIDFYE